MQYVTDKLKIEIIKSIDINYKCYENMSLEEILNYFYTNAYWYFLKIIEWYSDVYSIQYDYGEYIENWKNKENNKILTNKDKQMNNSQELMYNYYMTKNKQKKLWELLCNTTTVLNKLNEKIKLKETEREELEFLYNTLKKSIDNMNVDSIKENSKLLNLYFKNK